MKAAVAFISFFDNDMKQEIVDVEDNATWKDAYAKFLVKTKQKVDLDMRNWIMDMPDDLNEAREHLIDGEMDVVVTFIE